MISTAIYKLDVRDVQWDVAHLFEHLFIRAWYAHLADRGYNNALFGWVRGETFEERLFIDAGFYDVAVAQMFNDYLHRARSFDSSEIDAALADIGIEELSEITVSDMQRVQLELQKLSARFTSTTDADASLRPSQPNTYITLDDDAAQYHDVSLLITGENLSSSEQIVFLRLKVLLIDIINRSIGERYGYYEHGHSALNRHDKSMGYMSKITIRKSEVTLDTLEAHLNKSLRAFSARDNWLQISNHINAFANEPLWRNAPIEYFRETGIVTDTKEISELTVSDRVESILAKITIRVTPHDIASDQWIS